MNRPALQQFFSFPLASSLQLCSSLMFDVWLYFGSLCLGGRSERGARCPRFIIDYSFVFASLSGISGMPLQAVTCCPSVMCLRRGWRTRQALLRHAETLWRITNKSGLWKKVVSCQEFPAALSEVSDPAGYRRYPAISTSASFLSAREGTCDIV